MTLRHPFTWLAPHARGRAFAVLLVFTLGVMAALNALGAALFSEAAPQGIISFEFAGELSAARQIINAWGPGGQVAAGLSLGLDYLFLVLYAAAIGLGCVLVAEGFAARSTALARVGVVLAWGQLLAALLDAVENYALIRLLLGAGEALWPALARASALPKFALVALGLLYVLLGALALALRRPPEPARGEA